MRGIGLVRRIQEANGHARSFVRQRGIAGERLVAAAKRHLRRQVPKVPGRDPLALHARLRLGERQAGGFAQAPAQLAEIAAHRKLALGLVDHTHVHEEVRGRVFLRPDAVVEALAGDARGIFEDGFFHREIRPRAIGALRRPG